MRILKLSAAVMSLGLLMGTMASLARADELDWRTVVTFKEPVQIPGMVLAPGKYIFTLVSPTEDRTEFVVINAATNKALEMVSGFPVSHGLKPASKAEFILIKGDKPGAPERLQSWFYPGDDMGISPLYHNGR